MVQNTFGLEKENCISSIKMLDSELDTVFTIGLEAVYIRMRVRVHCVWEEW